MQTPEALAILKLLAAVDCQTFLAIVSIKSVDPYWASSTQRLASPHSIRTRSLNHMQVILLRAKRRFIEVLNDGFICGKTWQQLCLSEIDCTEFTQGKHSEHLLAIATRAYSFL